MSDSPHIDLDHNALVRDPEGALAALGAKLSHREWKDVAPNGRITNHRSIEGRVENPSRAIQARFVHQGLIERAKKAFVKEVEVGVSEFDDQIYVATPTRDETASLLAEGRVRQALSALVGTTGSVEIEGGVVQIEQEDPVTSLADARAEAIALLYFLR